MAAKSVLLKLTPEVHAAVQEAAKAHKRSMQSVLCGVIENWLDAGAPDPLSGPITTDSPRAEETVDQGARTAIEALTRHMRDIHMQVLDIAKRPLSSDHWSHRVLSDLEDIRAPQEQPTKPLVKFRRRKPETSRLRRVEASEE